MIAAGPRQAVVDIVVMRGNDVRIGRLRRDMPVRIVRRGSLACWVHICVQRQRRSQRRPCLDGQPERHQQKECLAQHRIVVQESQETGAL